MNSTEIPTFWNVKNYITIDNRLCVPNTGELYVSLKVYQLISQYTDLNGNVNRLEATPTEDNVFCIGLPVYEGRATHTIGFNSSVPLLTLTNSVVINNGFMEAKPKGSIKVTAFWTEDLQPYCAYGTIAGQPPFYDGVNLQYIDLWEGTRVLCYGNVNR
jgi:hypothetical protein